MSTPLLETTQTIPSRRSHPPDIIDVDLLDDNELAAFQRPLQRRRRDSVIDLEEIVEIPGPSSNRNPSQYRSPPPPRYNSVIPPLPSMPRHLRGLTSFPDWGRRRAPLPSSQPGVVRPSSQPFAFEANFSDAQANSTPSSTGAAPSSFHVPVMGFGGALLAVNSQYAREANDRTSHRRTRAGHHRTSRLPSFADATDYLTTNLRFFLRHVREERHSLFEEDDGLEDLTFHHFHDILQAPSGYSASSLPTATAKATAWNPEFTHPGKSPAGFTEDFGLPEGSSTSCQPSTSGTSSAASSTSSTIDTILVCAQCLDPLAIGGGSEHSDAERRLWALRCGHILDGKCIDGLMKPEDAIEEAAPLPPEAAIEPPALPPNGKGNLKKPQELLFENHAHISMEAPAFTPRIRNTRRLRSGRTIFTDEFDPNSHERPLRSRKGKGKMQAPVVEREHEWSCPVVGCRRVHQSLLIDKKWRMDERNGAIMMYV